VPRKQQTSPEAKLEAFLAMHPEWRGKVDLILYPPDREEALEQYPELRGDLILDTLDWPTTFGVRRISLYFFLRERGSSHNLASMVATQRGPGVNTDDTFFRVFKPLSEQFASDAELNKVVGIARRHGYNPGIHDVYVPQLARFRGDPKAFISRSMGRARIREVCRKRGWELSFEGSDRAMTADYRSPDSDPFEAAPKLAPDIVERGVKSILRENPGMAKKSRQELREMVIQRHGPSN
jgi:hypothetical protein